MKKATTLLLGLSPVLCFAQDPVVQGVIDAVQIDSMMHYVVQMDGEEPVDLGAGPVPIVSRNSYHEGNAMAQAYYEQKFAEFGYAVSLQSSSTTGRNILVTKTGALFPDTYVILCGHYDALPGALFAAPAADDDGSGCAAVLEAARVLRDIPFECSIIFALWDEEEQGRLGSIYYATQASGNDMDIRGVINMDAIAYDGDGDGRARVHSKNVANSRAIADTVLAVNERYGLGLDMINNHPGAEYSDHASFWNRGFGAVLMIEDWDDDSNPNYHSTTDLSEHFDVPYFEKLVKLSIASAATLAVPFDATAGLRDVGPSTADLVVVYPNPAVDDAMAELEVSTAGHYRVALMDPLGQEVALLRAGRLAQGRHRFSLPLSTLSNGAYHLVVRSSNEVQVVPLFKVP